MAPKKRGAPGAAGGKSKAKKVGELPAIAPDALAMPHLQLLDKWVFSS